MLQGRCRVSVCCLQETGRAACCARQRCVCWTAVFCAPREPREMPRKATHLCPAIASSSCCPVEASRATSSTRCSPIQLRGCWGGGRGPGVRAAAGKVHQGARKRQLAAVRHRRPAARPTLHSSPQQRAQHDGLHQQAAAAKDHEDLGLHGGMALGAAQLLTCCTRVHTEAHVLQVINVGVA